MKSLPRGVVKSDDPGSLYLPIHTHLLRRTYATLLYREGMKIRAIQEKTRHSNIETLMKHYVHDDDLASPYLEKIIIGVV
jgi:integrase